MMTNATEQEVMKVIVFQLADKEYAIPVSHVQGIEKLMHITRVPKTPHFVKGVINLRGVVTPIIDLRERFNLPISGDEETTRIIILCVHIRSHFLNDFIKLVHLLRLRFSCIAHRWNKHPNIVTEVRPNFHLPRFSLIIIAKL